MTYAIRGCEVMSSFLKILCQILLESQFSWGFSLFFLFFLPHLMNTSHIGYHWKGIFKEHPGALVLRCMDYFPQITWVITRMLPDDMRYNTPILYLRLYTLC